MNPSILCHRGIWKEVQEQNALDALVQAIKEGFGIETDLRSFKGRIVITHDPASSDNVLSLKELFERIKSEPNFRKAYYALNIKEDGIEQKVIELLDEFSIADRCFVFDMSVPSAITFKRKKNELKSKIMIATRESEYENATLYEDSQVVWMDEFESNWIDMDRIAKHINNGKIAVVVSPELHKREHKAVWQYCKDLIVQKKQVLLCTDRPFEFDKYLGD